MGRGEGRRAGFLGGCLLLRDSDDVWLKSWGSRFNSERGRGERDPHIDDTQVGYSRTELIKHPFTCSGDGLHCRLPI